MGGSQRPPTIPEYCPFSCKIASLEYWFSCNWFPSACASSKICFVTPKTVIGQTKQVTVLIQGRQPISRKEKYSSASYIGIFDPGPSQSHFFTSTYIIKLSDMKQTLNNHEIKVTQIDPSRDLYGRLLSILQIVLTGPPGAVYPLNP